MSTYFKQLAALIIIQIPTSRAVASWQAHPDAASVRETSDTASVSLQKQFRYSLTSLGIVTSDKQVPFWMRSNQYGSIPLKGISFSLVGRIDRPYRKTDKKILTDWGLVIEPRLNVGRHSELRLIEGYVKGRLGIFQLKAGRSRDLMGLVDSTLSSGAFSISGNSLGIPKVEISIPEFWNLPFTKGFFGIKGNFTHGWLGKTDVVSPRKASVTSLFHQKSLYARLGRADSKLKIFAGFNHQVFWGNERIINGDKFELSGTQTFLHVIFGQSYAGRNASLPRSKVGNHLGSIDQGIELSGKTLRLWGYHQFFYDVGGLYHLNNIKDGLFGLTIENKLFESSKANFRIKKVNFEFINTKSQGGEIDAKVTPSGDEDYYNNFTYYHGWTYKEQNLGNPLLTNKEFARTNLPATGEFFVNNRINGFNLGSEIAIYRWSILLRTTLSLNYGTYGTSPWGHSLNNIRYPRNPPYFGEEKQFSGLLLGKTKLRHNVSLSLGLAIDRGTLLYNSLGGQIGLSKSW